MNARRQGIHLHNQEYYWKMLEILGEQAGAKLYLAERQDKIIAANIVVYCGERAYYLHGATSDQNKNLMAPYWLQWQAILDAKAAGKKFYDFWGVSASKKSWQGITRF